MPSLRHQSKRLRQSHMIVIALMLGTLILIVVWAKIATQDDQKRTLRQAYVSEWWNWIQQQANATSVLREQSYEKMV